jgi:putative SOS response-associated peptidase YedK
MVVILPMDSYDDWLRAKPELSMDFMRQYPSEKLQAAAMLPAQQSLVG